MLFAMVPWPPYYRVKIRVVGGCGCNLKQVSHMTSSGEWTKYAIVDRAVIRPLRIRKQLFLRRVCREIVLP